MLVRSTRIGGELALGQRSLLCPTPGAPSEAPHLLLCLRGPLQKRSDPCGPLHVWTDIRRGSVGCAGVLDPRALWGVRWCVTSVCVCVCVCTQVWSVCPSGLRVSAVCVRGPRAGLRAVSLRVRAVCVSVGCGTCVCNEGEAPGAASDPRPVPQVVHPVSGDPTGLRPVHPAVQPVLRGHGAQAVSWHPAGRVRTLRVRVRRLAFTPTLRFGSAGCGQGPVALCSVTRGVTSGSGV